MRMPLRALRSRGSAIILAGALIIGPNLMAGSAHAATPTTAVSVVPASIGDICQTDLPSQADDTLDLIAEGGPYPYPEDGEVFRNDEGLLPSEASGYYHEYTVVTPGASTRGTRRIITAEDGTDYYTSDHYESFSTIDFSC